MTLTVLHGDARNLPLADNSVDLIVTSPPYFGLRSYQDGGEHYDGQLGDEATPAEFVDALIACTREWMRVLKPDGSLWVNLGDKYAQTAGQWQGSRRGQGGMLKGTRAEVANQFCESTWDDAPGTGAARPKSLIGIPWRYALRCIDDLGLILRAEVIWSKPNGLPESVTDRVRRSHEQWFHFTMQPRYFSAVDEIREEHSENTHARRRDGGLSVAHSATGTPQTGLGGEAQNPLGKLPGSVWTVATEPLKVPEHLGVDHFAAFPTEWPRRLILGWSPTGVCTACGEGRQPVAERESSGRVSIGTGARDPQWQAINRAEWQAGVTRIITGYACACPDTTAPTTPGVVLDPFGGTGTTAHVAHALGRHGISNDLSADYCRLAAAPELRDARWRKIHDIPKPAAQVIGQADLFGDPA